MKKILSFMTLLAAVTIFTACKDETDYTPSEFYILNVLEADVTFGPDNSTGSIVVDANQAVTAESNEPEWCHVSVNGNTVTVNVDKYEGLEARNAEVTLKSGVKTVAVPIHQSGLLVLLGGESCYVVDTEDAEDITIANKSNCDLTETVSDSWIHYTKTDDGYTFSFDDNTTTDYRRGEFTVTSGEYSRTVYFGQFGTEDPTPEGTYIAYYQEDGEWYYANVEIEAASATTYNIKGLSYYGYDFLLNHNASTGDYYITAGYSPGTYGSYTLRCVINYQNAAGTNYVSTTINTSATNAYRMSFAFDVDDEAYLVFKYVKNSNLSASYSTPGFGLYAYTSATSATATYRAGWLEQFYYVTMYKQ